MKLTKAARLIHDIRGFRVILDRDRAALYGVTTKNLNKAVSRNVLRSSRAVKVNIDIMRAFVRLRAALADDRDELTEHAAHINEAFAEIRRLPKPLPGSPAATAFSA